jgi:GNAT superfamily N-acetyltransferase
MDMDRLLTLYDREMRIEIEWFDTRREVTPDVVRQVSRNGSQGAIIYARFDAERMDQVISEQIDHFEHIGQGFEWKLAAHDPLPGLKDRLLARGFEVAEAEAVLVLDARNTPCALLGTVAHDLRRLDDPDALDDVVTVEQAVWNEDFTQLVHELGNEMRHDPQALRIYVAYLHGRPASCAWTRYHAGSSFASLWGGSTVPDRRGRGLYTALVAARVQEALARGVRYLTVDAGPMSAPILQRCGFRQLTVTTPCKWRLRRREVETPGAR